MFDFSGFSFVAFPSVLWYSWLGLLTRKNRLPYNLYCVGGDAKQYTQSNPILLPTYKTPTLILSSSFVWYKLGYKSYWRTTVHVMQAIGNRSRCYTVYGWVLSRGRSAVITINTRWLHLANEIATNCVVARFYDSAAAIDPFIHRISLSLCLSVCVSVCLCVPAVRPLRRDLCCSPEYFNGGNLWRRSVDAILQMKWEITQE